MFGFGDDVFEDGRLIIHKDRPGRRGLAWR
jgi:hypothetical protein